MNYEIPARYQPHLVGHLPLTQPPVSNWLNRQEGLNLYLSVVTIGELRKGVEKLPDSRKKSQLTRWIDVELPNRFEGKLVPIDASVAET